MKRILLIACVLVAFSALLKAQEFEVNDRVITPGIGFGSVLYTGNGFNTFLPPVSISYEQGLRSDVGPGIIGIGGYAGMAGSKTETVFNGDKYGYRYTSLILGARGFYHMDLVEELDTYGGLMLGYNIVMANEYGNWPIAATTNVGSGFSYSLFVGARYYFQKNLGVMAELGYGISYLTVGISYKL